MTLTPDGNKFSPTDPTDLNEAWITPTSHPNLAKYNANTTLEPYLEGFILDACAEINRICRRKFNKQQIDQIYKNETLLFDEYRDYVVNNRPLISVDNVWLQVVDTFSVVDLRYLQVLPDQSIARLLPTFSVNAQTSLPITRFNTSANLWIRHTSGYEVDQGNSINDVPRSVQQATALYVGYLYQSFDIDSGVAEFRTQRYSQKMVTDATQDPLLTRINSMLDKYIINSAR